MLKKLESLEELIEASHGRSVLLFKNSRTCPISSGARREVEAWTNAHRSPDIFMLTVQERRDLSQQLSTELGIEHETPQLILIRDGKAVWYLNHYSVKGEKIDRLIQDKS